MFSGQLRKSTITSNVAANITCNVIDSSNGLFNISMSSTTTSNIADGNYFYDVKHIKENQEVEIVQEGIFHVYRTHTR